MVSAAAASMNLGDKGKAIRGAMMQARL